MVDSEGAAAAVWDYRHDNHISKLVETWSAVGRSNGVSAAGQLLVAGLIGWWPTGSCWASCAATELRRHMLLSDFRVCTAALDQRDEGPFKWE